MAGRSLSPSQVISRLRKYGVESYRSKGIKCRLRTQAITVLLLLALRSISALMAPGAEVIPLQRPSHSMARHVANNLTGNRKAMWQYNEAIYRDLGTLLRCIISMLLSSCLPGKKGEFFGGTRFAFHIFPMLCYEAIRICAWVLIDVKGYWCKRL